MNNIKENSQVIKGCDKIRRAIPVEFCTRAGDLNVRPESYQNRLLLILFRASRIALTLINRIIYSTVVKRNYFFPLYCNHPNNFPYKHSTVVRKFDFVYYHHLTININIINASTTKTIVTTRIIAKIIIKKLEANGLNNFP